MGSRKWWAARALAMGALLVAPACSSADMNGDTASDGASDAASDAAAFRSVDGAAAADSDGAATANGSGGAQPMSSPVVASPRELVYTADLRVVARSVPAATRKVEGLVAGRGGFVFGQESRSGKDGDATLTLKVPSANFRALLDDLAGLGKEANRSVRTEDVTDVSVDLDARILSAQRSVERVRAFLDEARNVGELAGVEGELTRRETELEQLTAQRRALDDRVDLATVELTLTERPEPVVATSPGDPLRGVPGFGDALATGVDWLVRAFRLAAAALGYSLPFLVVLASLFGLRRLVRRRRDPSVVPA